LSPASIIILALIAMTPLLAIAPGLETKPFIALVATIALLLAVTAAPAPELQRTRKALTHGGWLLLLPAVWMIVQLIPLPLSMSNPLWAGVATALPDHGSYGHVTVSLPDTLRSLGTYLGWMVLVAACAVAFVDRRCAEYGLIAAPLAALTIAILGFVGRFWPSLSNENSTSFPVASALSCVLTVAAVQRAIERRQTHRTSVTNSWLVSLTLSGAAVLVSLALAVGSAPSVAWVGAMLGAFTVAMAALMSRLGLIRIASIVIVLLVALAGGAFLASKADHSSQTTGLMSVASGETKGSVERALRDASLLGSGSGTYGTLAATLQDFGEPPQPTPPSLAIELAVEWGRAAPLVITVIVLIGVGIFVNAALHRGRDSFYATAAAGCLVGATFQSFFDIGVLDPAISLLLAVVVGLGLGQATGRSSAT